MKHVHVRLCPAGGLPLDSLRGFEELPRRGETILDQDDDKRYVVVEIDWQSDGSPFVIAHEWGRPRAQAILYGDEK